MVTIFARIINRGAVLAHMLYVIFSCLLLLNLAGATQERQFSTGLRFYGYPDRAISDKTTLNLTPKSSINIAKSFTLSFDISIWNVDEFGFIFWMEGVDGQCISLANVDWKHPDTTYFDLAVDRTNTPIKIPLAKKNLSRVHWDKLDFGFDLANDKVTAHLNGAAVSSGSVELADEFSFDLLFGYRTETSSVPQMALKNVKVISGLDESDNSKLLHHWPLSEHSGSVVMDIAGDSQGLVENGKWLAERHVKWSFLKELFIVNCQVTYDDIRQRLIIVSADSLYYYYPTTDKLEKIPYAEPFEVYLDTDLMFDTVHDRLIAYYKNDGNISVWDERSRVWSVVDESFFTGEYNSSARFIDQEGVPYLLGGYGYYKTKKSLQKYNFSTDRWDRMPDPPEAFGCRANIVVCRGSNPAEFYVSGGHGNQTGDQEAGFKKYYDLWKLNLDEYSWEMLWSEKDLSTDVRQQLKSTTLSRMVYSPDEDDIYVLISSSVGKTSQLYRMGIKEPRLEEVGEEISADNLYYNSSAQEFYTISIKRLDDTIKMNIYSLSYPPLENLDIFAATVAGDGSGMSSLLIVLVILGIIILGYSAGVMLKKKWPAPKVMMNQRPTSVGEISSVNISEKSSIQLFGNFRVTDRQGYDITAQFTPQMKELYLFIRLHSASNGRNGNGNGNGNGAGVSTEQILAHFWPDIDPTKMKNAKGSAISRLRSLLNQVGEIHIETNNGIWALRNGEDVQCDYVRYCQAKAAMTNGDNQKGSRAFLDIVEKGPLLPELNYPWLDSIQSDMMSDIITLCDKTISELDVETDHILHWVNVVLLWDSLEEEALKTKLQILSQKGHHGAVKKLFNKFVEEYQETYDEPFSHDLKTMIS